MHALFILHSVRNRKHLQNRVVSAAIGSTGRMACRLLYIERCVCVPDYTVVVYRHGRWIMDGANRPCILVTKKERRNSMAFEESV